MKQPMITGVGITDFGRFPEFTEEAMVQSAILDALEDAGTRLSEVQAFYCGNALGAMLPGQRALRELHADGGAVYNVDNACSSGATALNLALQALEVGQYDTVLVFGMDHLSGLGGGPLQLSQQDWNNRRGMIMPALYAMRARRYMHDHGLKLETLADISVKNRKHGVLNPIAKFAKLATREDVLASRPVAEPLTLLQCCPAVVDGAAALVLSTKPSKGVAKPVQVLASVVQSGLFETTPVDMTEAEITARAARLAYEQAGVGPQDLSLLEVHDAFTISELLYYEALGLCDRGDAAGLLHSGATALGGRVPVNPSGGLLAKGHPPGATGVAQIVEICEQLQGRAGARQVQGARIGLTQVTGGGIWGVDHAACAIHILSL
ncbi:MULTISPECIES: thiolase family protein [unclassified Variovorax]|uniref:thiolase family protein n=1 Tax=unclassified Variovorax TaxID=663243 RepID=UPI0008399C82|nr:MULTISPECIES: thiolase family protein [unclassified Variovorax]PNG56064.1 3-ketoacyl-CoA thiolase [Variovorax sp. B4]PNG57488.1 3-ketoacyl-CoA thiolase [Variovorax sp. B2]VTV10128.1 acetyl-CoA acetyltransferase [Variovorax sp. WDL1]